VSKALIKKKLDVCQFGMWLSAAKKLLEKRLRRLRVVAMGGLEPPTSAL
jgi:hypothetical protein